MTTWDHFNRPNKLAKAFEATKACFRTCFKTIKSGCPTLKTSRKEIQQVTPRNFGPQKGIFSLDKFFFILVRMTTWDLFNRPNKLGIAKAINACFQTIKSGCPTLETSRKIIQKMPNPGNKQKSFRKCLRKNAFAEASACLYKTHFFKGGRCEVRDFFILNCSLGSHKALTSFL